MRSSLTTEKKLQLTKRQTHIFYLMSSREGRDHRIGAGRLSLRMKVCSVINHCAYTQCASFSWHWFFKGVRSGGLRIFTCYRICYDNTINLSKTNLHLNLMYKCFKLIYFITWEAQDIPVCYYRLFYCTQCFPPRICALLIPWKTF